VNDTSSERIDELKKAIDKICEGKCHLGGEIVAYSEFAKLVPQTLMKGLMTSLLLVGLVLSVIAVAQNKGKYLFTCLISSYWGAFFTIFILEVFNSQVDFWKAIFASILVGLAGDNTIQFLFASENKTIDDGISERGVPSIITSVFMALTSLIYLFSYYSSPRTFGIILSLGILSILFGDLWLFKSFNRFLKK
jgi:predicted RND superfamily exporter protein